MARPTVLGGDSALPASVFVPDEEAARSIDAFLAALAARSAAEPWPGWPAKDPAALVLPGGVGVCVAHLPVAGRPVAARDGGTVPGLVHVLDAAGADEAAGAGDSALDADHPVGPGVRAALRRIAGRPVVALWADEPSAADMARAFHRAAFALWWRARGGAAAAEAGRGDSGPARSDDAVEVALAHLEGRLLLEALGAVGPTGGPPAELTRAATALALVRRERRGRIDDERVAWERAAEVGLGIPAYVGCVCAVACGAPAPGPRLGDALEGLGRLSAGARGEAEGAAIALLLDALAASGAEPARGGGDWRREVDPGDAPSLDAALERWVQFDGGPRDDAAIAAAQRRHGFDALVRAEERALEERRRARAALLEEILRGPGTLVVCDVGRLGPATVGSTQPPEAVNAGLDLYREGGTFHYRHGAVVAVEGLPVAHDRRAGLLQLRVAGPLAFRGDGEALAPEAAAFEAGLSLRVAGLRVAATSGEVRRIDGGYMLRLQR